MNRLLHTLRRPAAAIALAALLPVHADALAQATGPGHSPTRDLEMVDEGANQIDKIGVMVDRELQFTDERGYPFQLKQLFPGKQPVVLMLGYYQCPSMCGQVLGAAFDALNEVDLQPGEDYRILNVSVDPKETAEIAANRKAVFLRRLLKTGGEKAWNVLVGDKANTSALADSVGFKFYWSEATGQFAHPPSLMFLTPEGKLSRVIVNTYFEPDDVRLALVEASEGNLGTFWDQVKLNCLTFDPRTNSYSLAAMTLMRVGGAITVVVLAVMIWLMLRREKNARAAAASVSNASVSPATGADASGDLGGSEVGTSQVG
ncbi:MAG: SCO family protein [Planctomycetota bacterium]